MPGLLMLPEHRKERLPGAQTKRPRPTPDKFSGGPHSNLLDVTVWTDTTLGVSNIEALKNDSK
jgi:hypothetical protein